MSIGKPPRVGLFINISGDYNRLSEFQFAGGERHKAHDKEAPSGRIHAIRCPACQGSYFVDGRFIGEYMCDTCLPAQYVEVRFHPDN